MPVSNTTILLLTTYSGFPLVGGADTQQSETYKNMQSRKYLVGGGGVMCLILFKWLGLRTHSPLGPTVAAIQNLVKEMHSHLKVVEAIQNCAKEMHSQT